MASEYAGGGRCCVLSLSPSPKQPGQPLTTRPQCVSCGNVPGVDLRGHCGSYGAGVCSGCVYTCSQRGWLECWLSCFLFQLPADAHIRRRPSPSPWGPGCGLTQLWLLCVLGNEPVDETSLYVSLFLSAFHAQFVK